MEHKLSLAHQRTSSYPFYLQKDWISSALLLSQETCISLSLVWTVLHIFEYAALLETELVSLRYALCFSCFSSRSPWISSSSWCLRDTGPRESIAEEWMVSLKTVQISGSSEVSSTASNRLQISLMKACLLLSCFSLETSSLFGTCGRHAG